MTQGVLKTHGICLMMYFKKIIGMLVHFFYFMDILEEKNHIYIYIYIYIRLKIKPNSVRIRF